MIRARALSTKSDTVLFKFPTGLIALLWPTGRRTYRIDLLGQGKRFELPENTPLRMLLRAIQDGKGGGR